MAVRNRTSLEITRQALSSSTGEEISEALERHLENLAETVATMWLNHYRGGKCSLRDLLAAVEPYALAAGIKGDAVLAGLVRDVIAQPVPERKKGGPAHPDSLRFYGWALADFYIGLGFASQVRDEPDSEAPAFVKASEEMRRLGLGDHSPGSIRGMWQVERRRWVRRARK